jgi:hypothetical protein
MAVYTTITKIDAELPSHSPDDAVVLRPEQLDAVDRAFKYFKKKKSNQKYLWNAKMRFGKTLCALELARKMGAELDGEEQVHRTLIVTHRPVVKQSWKEDFDKIFGKDCESYHYGTKFDDDGSDDFYELERSVKEEGKSYVFFASMQYLRRSTLVGGDNDEQLKKDILQNAWDLVVIDEAHEGTQTNLGQRVIDFLIKDKPTKALHLSGTPFNLYEDFTDEQIYTWDYIKEQTSKREWSQNHPLLPSEENPYLELPEMEIRTFDLGKLVKADLGEDATFQFKEFFRTYQGQNVPEDKKGKFVHEDAVKEFLDRMCQEDETSHYPFSTEEYRTFFNHTLWVVPGVKEAKALEDLLNDHEIFGGFDAIINVAGKNEDDETRQDALQKVKDKIGARPDLTYTITISCGRLTTGVTVRPWTAVFYLKGSENTSAATYMQTIFRVQSPYHYKDSNGDVQMKTKCYVFDFAPDRTLKMVAETAKFATLTQKQKQYARAATSREKDIENMENFLSFCPVIAMEGGAMVEFKADKLFEQLEHVYVDRVVRNGFNDNSVYDIRELMNLNPEEIKELDGIGEEISKTTNMEKPKRATNIEVSKNKLTPNQQAAAERAHKKEKAGKELTEEEKAALEAEKKRKEEERKERDNRITILRGIALRIPLLMYGANVTDEEEGITLQNFTRLIDDSSWAEFMPRGVDKKAFNKFKKCFNATVFVAAGKRYRQLAREADSMHINERIQRIAEIFSYFHNPDKETVLTPWRVVNMHMSDCLGGYTFYNERFDGPAEKEVIGRNGTLFEWIPTTEPRYVDRGDVTHDVFGNSNAKILEINSKTGLYPLYVAYSLYRQRCKDFVKAGLIEDENNYSVEEEQVIWDDILANNIYVICNTPMAELITHRTLLGFRTLYQRNGTEQVNIKSEKLIERATTDKDGLIADIKRSGYWRGTRNKEEMNFSAVVGNPPYQEKKEGTSDNPIYHIFYDISFSLANKVTLITPARFLYNAGKTPTEWNNKILNDPHVKVIWCKRTDEVFPNVDIKGGIAVTYRDNQQEFGKIGIFTKHDELNEILSKVLIKKGNESLSDLVYAPESYKFSQLLHERYPWAKDRLSSGHLYDITSNIFEKLPELFTETQQEGYVGFYGRLNNERCYRWINRNLIDNHENLDFYKVILPKSNGSGSLGEVLTNPIVGRPLIGHTQTFISIGKFETEEEAEALLKYIKTRLLRTLLGILKVTQDNKKSVWAYIPLQDFTSNSDIDWSKSVAEVDKQLYKKYGLSQDEQDFIESMIKPME